jgi:hypothetical protein
MSGRTAFEALSQFVLLLAQATDDIDLYDEDKDLMDANERFFIHPQVSTAAARKFHLKLPNVSRLVADCSCLPIAQTKQTVALHTKHWDAASSLLNCEPDRTSDFLQTSSPLLVLCRDRIGSHRHLGRRASNGVQSFGRQDSSGAGGAAGQA